MISVTMACCLMTALPPAPADALPGAAQDIRKLPPHYVLLVTEGETITVKKPTGGTMKVRLLGVAAPPANSPYLRGKYLEDQIKDRDVGLDYDPGQKLDNGRVSARVYRLPDGLLINLAMVEAGFGVPAADAPPSLIPAFRSAEREARARELGLWSPTALDEAAAHDREEALRREEYQQQTRQRAEMKRQRRINLARANAARFAMMTSIPWGTSPGPSISTSSDYSTGQVIVYQYPYQVQPCVPQMPQSGAMSQRQGYITPSSYSGFNGTGLDNNGRPTTSSFNGTGLDNNGRPTAPNYFGTSQGNSGSSSSSSYSSGTSNSGSSSSSGFAGYPSHSSSSSGFAGYPR
jgi:endonuclease YncB( thermonuclease family)